MAHLPAPRGAIRAEWVTIPLQAGGDASVPGDSGAAMPAWWARPAEGEPRGLVLVLPEVFGVNAWVRSVADRLAGEGYGALAISTFWRTAPHLDLAYDAEGLALGREHRDQVTADQLLADVAAAAAWLQQRHGPQPLGCVGFCFGGSVVNSMAVMLPDLAAAVPYYGNAPKAEDVTRIKAPLLIHHGELDKRLMEGLPAYEAALKAAGKSYEAFVYPNANHGFHNDTTPRYEKQPAELSWDRTIAFFKKHLA